ncbi:hypothetical protein PRZ48_009831 [Zasmidium cellare]|uniref:Uncharacterized protein n=1 Tax=Zasmidium cellare TaxID=395010 RepID=A0ABR0EDV6_ZASCE|nr:hypothetical protein PRZ48_009831 [Zasmidium cellare]
MPATRTTAKTQGLRSGRPRLPYQVANEPALKARKQKVKPKSANALVPRRAARNATPSSISPASSTTTGPAGSGSPSETTQADQPNAHTHLEALVNAFIEGQKRQQQQLDRLVSEITSTKASIQATNTKVDREGDRAFGLANLIKASVYETHKNLSDVSDMVRIVVDYVERLVRIENTVENIEASVSNIEREIGTSSALKGAINDFEEDVDDSEESSDEDDPVERFLGMSDHLHNLVDAQNQPKALLDDNNPMLAELFHDVMHHYQT